MEVFGLANAMDDLPYVFENKETLNVPRPRIRSDNSTADGEYAGVFYGESSDTEIASGGASITLIADEFGNFEATVIDGTTTYSINGDADGAVTYTSATLSSFGNEDTPLDMDPVRRSLYADHSSPPTRLRGSHAADPGQRESIYQIGRQLEESCYDIGGSPSGTWDSGWTVGSDLYDCAYFVDNDVCDYATDTNYTETYDNFRNFGWLPTEACCGCGGGITGGSDLSPGSSTWAVMTSIGRVECDWFEEDADHCTFYGHFLGTGGYSANQACRVCGGGSLTAASTTPSSRTIDNIVNILVVYTSEALINNGATASGGASERAMENFIDRLATETNTALSNGGSSTRINIVGTHHNTDFNLDTPDSGLTNLHWLQFLNTTDDGHFDYETNTLRKSLGADLVFLIAENIPSGLALILGTFGVGSRDYCDLNLTFGHEGKFLLRATKCIYNNLMP